MPDPVTFEARAIFNWKPDRLYRVYVERDRLVFIWIAGQRGMETGDAVAAQFGLVGWLIRAWMTKRKERRAAGRTRRY